MVSKKTRGFAGVGTPSRGLSVRCLFGLGVPELAVIAGVAALVFGPKKLPEIGRSIGKTVKSFQQVRFLVPFFWKVEIFLSVGSCFLCLFFC